MKRILTTLALACGLAVADDLAVRNLTYVNDVRFNSQQTRVMEWYQGESVQYDTILVRDSRPITIPTNAYPVWRVWRSNDTSVLYVNVTGTVYDASRAYSRVTLAPAQANMPTGYYTSVVSLYQGTNYMGVAGAGPVMVRYSPVATNLGYVGTVRSHDFLPRPTNTWTSGYVLSSYDGGTTTVAIAAGIGTLTNVAVSGGLLTVGVTGATANVGLSTATVRTAVNHATLTNDAWTAILAGNWASNAAVASLTNIVVQEGTSNAVMVANRIATLTLRTNYTAGGGTSDLQLGVADTNAYAGSWGVTVSNTADLALAAGDYSSNALSSYVRRTVTITNQAFMATNGVFSVFPDVFGTFPYMQLGDPAGNGLGLWWVGATNRRRITLEDVGAGGRWVDVMFNPTPRTTNVFITSGNSSNYFSDTATVTWTSTNGVMYAVAASSGGGSQTPWTNTVNAATYSLTNLTSIGSANTTNLSFTIGTNTYYIRPY